MGAVGAAAADDVGHVGAVALEVDRVGVGRLRPVGSSPVHVSPTKSKPPFTFGALGPNKRRAAPAGCEVARRCRSGRSSCCRRRRCRVHRGCVGEVDAGVEHGDLHAGAVEARLPAPCRRRGTGRPGRGCPTPAGRLRRVVAGHGRTETTPGIAARASIWEASIVTATAFDRLGDAPCSRPPRARGPVGDAVLLVLDLGRWACWVGASGTCRWPALLGQWPASGRLGQPHDHLDRSAGPPQARRRPAPSTGRAGAGFGGLVVAAAAGPPAASRPEVQARLVDQQADARCRRSDSFLPRRLRPRRDIATSGSLAQDRRTRYVPRPSGPPTPGRASRRA